MKECSKSIHRRMHDPNYINRYFVGDGLDIGGKPDPLALYSELFCQVKSIRTWDWEDGDAEHLESVDDNTYDFVHSSHCLEHLKSPERGLGNWIRSVKPGGYLVLTVPDEDLYEQGVFPSTFNRDHKWTFTIHKSNSWSDKSINLLDLLVRFTDQVEILKIELLNYSYRYSLPRYDQTLTPIAECGIEIILRKKERSEIEYGGIEREASKQPTEEMRIHYNQYKDDVACLKLSNAEYSPFNNKQAL